ncbi:MULTISPECIES: AAA family ATPase [unclassified Pantoea]|uniref:AAA family ATPase n=1 Tax=unclassified Pantoea TaxID=2630326 RepID=UPI001CD701DD|nr:MULTISPECIES: AAA family ATPase [unclassified Pantoea]MCA1174826.1 AAA family ATPase [Pantoea sp. alder69]MCA1253926.1 AAA family ATPase [Pantoea sp. alder70]MCA1264257.1 AAA family ATPase [Pantoea sp. alder81]
MAKYIRSIAQKTNAGRRKIIIDGKNLIIVGNNGAGKTKFLKALQSSLNKLFQGGQYQTSESLNKLIDDHNSHLKQFKIDTEEHNNILNAISHYKSLLDEKNVLDVTLSSSTSFIQSIKNNEIIFRFFEAGRFYNSDGNNLLTSIDSLFERFKSNNSNFQSTSSYFESYLVSMSNYALLEKGAEQIEEYNRVNGIVQKIQYDLRSLFEDESLLLSFNRKKLRMEINQKNKDPFSLSHLPSGYSSILAIYAELIMVSELSNRRKDEIKGIVIIDEVDAHLHVTLQKKVFNFLSESFKDIQFIISTHSPFVVQSVSDAIIYNLSKNEKMEDLSIYSYSSIIKGLLGETTNSNELEGLLNELSTLSKKDIYNSRFHSIISILEENMDFLNPKAKATFLGAKSKFIDWKEEQDNV